MDPERYDRWFDTPWGRHASGVEQAALERGAGAVAGRRLLDVGCGTGRFTAGFAARGARVTGVDLDPAMLAVASTRVQGPLVVADAHRLPFPGDVFDVTVAVTLCEFTADPVQVVGELARVTRPGGRIVVGALNRRSPWGGAGWRRLRQPPWDAARFLRRRELLAVGTHHGRAAVTGALFAPGVAPGGQLGRLLERGGRRALPALGAFQLLVVDKVAAGAVGSAAPTG